MSRGRRGGLLRALPPTCNLSSWAAATSRNAAARRLIVVDSWRFIGLGNSVIGAAKWMALMSTTASARRAIQFAYCVPRELTSQFRWPTAHRMPACEDAHFDLYAHLTFRGAGDLRAVPGELVNATATGVLRAPRCDELRAALHGPARVIAVHAFHGRELDRCVATTRASWPLCLRLVTAIAEAPSPVRRATRVPTRPECTIGLHLRTLALDTGGQCNLLSPSADRRPSRAQTAGRRCREERSRRRRRCARVAFPASIQGCHAGDAVQHEALFASADTAVMYGAFSRPAGWTDLNETASISWTAPQLSGDVGRTVAAWLALARCTRAIVAPIPSAFSDSAAMAAGVPLVGCCQAWRVCAATPRRCAVR